MRGEPHNREARLFFCSVENLLFATKLQCLVLQSASRSRVTTGKDLLHLGNDSLESFGMVDSEVGKNLAVDFNTSLVQTAHQLAVAYTLDAGSSIDTLNPQSAEGALLVATIAEGIGQTLLPSVLGNGPNVLASADVTAGQLQNSLSLSSTSYVIY